MRRNGDTIRSPKSWRDENGDSKGDAWADLGGEDGEGWIGDDQQGAVEEYKDWYNEKEEYLKGKIERIEIPREIIERYSILSELPRGVCVMGGNGEECCERGNYR